MVVDKSITLTGEKLVERTEADVQTFNLQLDKGTHSKMLELKAVVPAGEIYNVSVTVRTIKQKLDTVL